MLRRKRICFRITLRRVGHAILILASIVNVLIVGAVFNETPLSIGSNPETAQPSETASLFPTVDPVTPFTFTPSPTQTGTSTPTLTPTNTETQTPSLTPTYTFTASVTSTFTPSPMPCIQWTRWPTYIVQAGDTLWTLARMTGSSVEELMKANCLYDTIIRRGQVLYVPRLPIITITPPTTVPARVCIDFEDQPPQAIYYTGQSFTSSNQMISVNDFVYSNGQATNNGIASISHGGLAGASGAEVSVGNVNLDFYFNGYVNSLSLLFGEYGGNINIDVNGDFRNIGSLNEVDGLIIGGVKVSVLNGYGQGIGSLELYGTIKSFAIGGQEFFIDHVCHE